MKKIYTVGGALVLALGLLTCDSSAPTETAVPIDDWNVLFKKDRSSDLCVQAVGDAAEGANTYKRLVKRVEKNSTENVPPADAAFSSLAGLHAAMLSQCASALPPQCLIDGDCDDGLMCNGAELCSGGNCARGIDEPDGTPCDEGAGSDGDPTNSSCQAGICVPVAVPVPEVCNGVDDDLNGDIDDGLVYCIEGNGAPNTDAANSCLPGWYDVDVSRGNGCESRPDSYEPNSFGEATNLGTLLSGNEIQITANIVPAGDDDWFRFYIEDNGSICGTENGPRLYAFFPLNYANQFRLRVWRGGPGPAVGGTQINTFGGETGAWEFPCVEFGFGDYWAEVWHSQGAASPDDYVVSFSFGVYP